LVLVFVGCFLENSETEKAEKKRVAVVVHGARRQEHARNGCGFCFPAPGAGYWALGASSRSLYIGGAFSDVF
jgi:hypothetical protein